MPSTFDFTGKVAIITGAASGIGLVTVKLFLASHAKVVAVDISALKDEELLTAAKDEKGSLVFHSADLTSKNAPKDIVNLAIKHFGRIDILANVAGIVDGFGTAVTVTDEMMDRVLDVNLKAPVRLMAAALPKMVEQGEGVIVNVSSKAGLSGACSGIAYAASKHGLIGATKNTAWQFRDKGIRCNAVAPGAVLTGIMGVPTPDKVDMECYGNTMQFSSLVVSETRPPMDPSAVAKSIAFLSSELSTEINGAILPIDKAWAAV